MDLALAPMPLDFLRLATRGAKVIDDFQHGIREPLGWHKPNGEVTFDVWRLRHGCLPSGRNRIGALTLCQHQVSVCALMPSSECGSYVRLLVLRVHVVVTSLAYGEAREDYRDDPSHEGDDPESGQHGREVARGRPARTSRAPINSQLAAMTTGSPGTATRQAFQCRIPHPTAALTRADSLPGRDYRSPWNRPVVALPSAAHARLISQGRARRDGSGWTKDAPLRR